jgi:hypothetical protein
MAVLNAMTELYRTFQIHGEVEPISETLMGRTTEWYASSRIAYIRPPNQTVVELTRFRLSCVKFDDQSVAAWFGMELAGSLSIRTTENWSSNAMR